MNKVQKFAMDAKKTHLNREVKKNFKVKTKKKKKYYKTSGAGIKKPKGKLDLFI